jgi:hypothetical protein
MMDAIAKGRDIHTEATLAVWGGCDNPKALKRAEISLELASESTLNEHVKALWQEVGWDPKFSTDAKARSKLAYEWLSRFNGDIVTAEKSIDKKTCRGIVKQVTFGKVYGAGPGSVVSVLGVTQEEAVQILHDYDAAFPAMASWCRSYDQQAKKEGCLWNRFGRRLRIDPAKAYRAVNYLIQGSAADLLKKAMRDTVHYLQETGLDAHLVITLHDELVFEIRKEHAFRWLLNGIKDRMEDHGGAFNVATPSEMKMAKKCWAEKVKVDL